MQEFIEYDGSLQTRSRTKTIEQVQASVVSIST